MKCVICKHGETAKGKTTVTFERKGVTLIFKGVPADICENSGEAYIDDVIFGRLIDQTEEAMALGVQVNIGEYRAAG